MTKDLLHLLEKYREALLLFYTSLRLDQWDSAISFIPYIEELEQKLKAILNDQKLNHNNKNSNIVILIKKILFIQKKIESLYYQKQSNINTVNERIFHSKIDFLIKKFLQEKGL